MLDSLVELNHTHYMSKRLQVLLPEDEFEQLQQASKSANKTVAEWVRESIRVKLREQRPKSPEKRLALILKFASHSGPTGSIEQILAEIEAGRDS